jgi:hypothetical protein
MSQFMGQEFSSVGTVRTILSAAKNYILSYCVSHGTDRARRLRCPRIRMHSYLAEIASEARLHEGASNRIELLARRAQDFVNNGRDL